MSQSPHSRPAAVAGRSVLQGAALMVVAVSALSFWLWRIPLEWYLIKSDDFDYLFRSRTAAAQGRSPEEIEQMFVLGPSVRMPELRTRPAPLPAPDVPEEPKDSH